MESQLENVQQQPDSIIYPILTLPAEITSEIFAHCLPTAPSWDVKEAPLLLMHVCSAWREIAISTSELWSTFDIGAEHLQPRLLDVLDTWLPRAHLRPLSVKMASPSFPEIPDFADRFFELLRRHSGEMRSVDLCIMSKDYERMAKRRLTFPLLQKLAIGFSERDAPGSTCVNVFNDAPMLYEVLMDFAPPSFIALPWQQLTKFTGAAYTLIESWEALHLMPNVIECRFVGGFGPDDGTPPDTVLHPKMRSLTLVDSDSDILDFLTLPALQTLEIVEARSVDYDILNDFLSRSAAPLRRFVIQSKRHMWFPSISLSVMPALVDIEIDRPLIRFVEELFLSKGGMIAVPELQTLSLLGCRERECEASIFCVVALAAIFFNGKNPWRHLRSLRFVSALERFLAHFPDNLLSPFKELKGTGIDVYIGTATESYL